MTGLIRWGTLHSVPHGDRFRWGSRLSASMAPPPMTTAKVVMTPCLPSPASRRGRGPPWRWIQIFGGKGYESKNSRQVEKRNFYLYLPTHLHLAPPLGAISSEFCRDLLHRKTRALGLSYGVVFWNPTFSRLNSTPTNGQTVGQTRDDSKYRISIASHA